MFIACRQSSPAGFEHVSMHRCSHFTSVQISCPNRLPNHTDALRGRGYLRVHEQGPYRCMKTTSHTHRETLLFIIYLQKYNSTYTERSPRADKGVYIKNLPNAQCDSTHKHTPTKTELTNPFQHTVSVGISLRVHTITSPVSLTRKQEEESVYMHLHIRAILYTYSFPLSNTRRRTHLFPRICTYTLCTCNLPTFWKVGGRTHPFTCISTYTQPYARTAPSSQVQEGGNIHLHVSPRTHNSINVQFVSFSQAKRGDTFMHMYLQVHTTLCACHTSPLLTCKQGDTYMHVHLYAHTNLRKNTSPRP